MFKKPIQTLSTIGLLAFVALMLQLFFSQPCIEYNIDYQCISSDRTSISIMYTSLYLFLTSLISLIIYINQGMYLKKQKLSINAAVRQGLEISTIILTFILLNKQNLLKPWIGLLIVSIIALLEYIILNFTNR